jgi:SNF family Na+-dependent transporter
LAASGDFPIWSLTTGDLISGGAFLIPYLIFLVFMVFPILTIETATGQFFRRSIYNIYERYSRKWVGTTFLVVGVSGMISSYYIYLMAYCVIYLYASIFEDLDWLYLPENQLLFALKKYFEENILQQNYDPSQHVVLKGFTGRLKFEGFYCSDSIMDSNLFIPC